MKNNSKAHVEYDHSERSLCITFRGNRAYVSEEIAKSIIDRVRMIELWDKEPDTWLINKHGSIFVSKSKVRIRANGRAHTWTMSFENIVRLADDIASTLIQMRANSFWESNRIWNREPQNQF